MGQLSIKSKDILKLAAPISISLLIPEVSFLTDTIFLGKLGEVELGINGIAGVFYLILSMVGYGLANGIQVLMSRRIGEGKNKQLARTFTNGMVLCLMFGIGLMAVSFIIVPIIFTQTLQNDTNAYLTVEFLSMRVWGLPFLILTQLVNAFFIATRQSKYLIYGSIISAGVNIVFDYGLIFGNMGLPQMGMVGAAVASVLAEVVFCTVMFSIFYLKKMQQTYPILSTAKFDRQLAKRSLMIAAPLILQFLFSMGGWQIFFIYVEHLGTRELAVSQILRSVFGVAGIGLWALASSCNTMVGNVIGQQKEELVMTVILRTIRLAVIYAFVLGSVLVMFPTEFLSMYRDDDSLVSFGRPSLIVVATATPLMAIATVLFNGVMGTGNTRVNMLIEICCVSTYVLYCYVIIERMRMPLHWAWASEFVYWGVLIIGSAIYLRTGKWKGKVI